MSGNLYSGQALSALQEILVCSATAPLEAHLDTSFTGQAGQPRALNIAVASKKVWSPYFPPLPGGIWKARLFPKPHISTLQSYLPPTTPPHIWSNVKARSSQPWPPHLRIEKAKLHRKSIGRRTFSFLMNPAPTYLRIPSLASSPVLDMLTIHRRRNPLHKPKTCRAILKPRRTNQEARQPLALPPPRDGQREGVSLL